MIGKVFNYLKYFLNKRKQILNNLIKYQEYLSNGTYKLLPNIAYKQGTSHFFKIKMNLFQNMIFYKNINIYSENKYFDGNLLYINAKNDVKLFSDSEVLTFMDKNELKKYMLIYNEVKNYFNVPKIIKYTDSYYIEEFIKTTEKIDPKEVFEEIIVFYKKNSKSIKIKKLENIYFNGENENIFIKTHGDLHLGNVLKYQNKLYFIDFEYFGERVFYYDFINLIFVPALDKDLSLLKAYFSNKYDNWFIQLFKLFGKEFRLENKIIYLNTYLNQRIKYIDESMEKKEKYKDIICAV